MALEIINNAWVVQENVVTVDTIERTLKTAGTFLDRNIDILIIPQEGNVVSVVTDGDEVIENIVVTSTCEAIGATADLSGVLETPPSSGAYITLSSVSNNPGASITGTVTTTVTSGFVSADKSNTQNVTANFSTNAGSDTKYISLYEGHYL